MGTSRCETPGDPLVPELGRYRIEAPLGRGGMGVVYQGRDVRLGRVVAIKLLPEPLARDAEALARFEREARVLAGLHHPHIAAIHGVGRRADGSRYLVLERVEGETLVERLARGPMTVAEALDVGRQVARALAAAHEREVVHRDLKPGNVMRTPAGLAKVLDFGLALRVEDRAEGAALVAGPDGEEANQITLAGRAPGTPGYMSPEQILGETAGAAADLFSFGCLLYECLTGRRAFPGARVSEVVDATLGAGPDWTLLPPELPEAALEALRRCLAKNPGERPSAEDLERGLAGPASEANGMSPGPADAPTPVRSLPEETSGFVGREAEMDECEELFERCRLLTLTGGGGGGKTRLALRIAERLHARRRWNAWFCDLGPVGEDERVPFALATALGAPEGAGPILDAVIDHLEGRDGLLVLDNCEARLASAADLVRELLARAPRLRVLATSREWLGVPGEQAYRVRPLSVPVEDAAAGPEEALRSEAVRLFLDRALRVRPDFRLSGDNVAAVSRLCRRLDGIPLAIELAACQTGALTPVEIEAQLGAGQAAHDGASEANPMTDAIRWSYGRLEEPERCLLRALSVFPAGATLDAAIAVADEPRDAFEVLDRLTALVDRSLAVLVAGSDPEARYRMLEPVRELMAGELRARAEERGRREAGLRHFEALGEAAAPALPGGPRQARWLTRLEAEHQNLLAAFDWCEIVADGDERALRLAGWCWRFWYIRGHFGIGRRVLEVALARPGARGATADRAQALFGAGGLAAFQGDPAAAEVFDRECLEIYRGLGDRAGVARALVHLAVAASERDDHEAAEGLYEEALAIYRDVGEVRGAATTLNNLGVVARYRGDYAAAIERWNEALAPARSGGDLDTLGLLLINLALVSTRLGRPAPARAWLAEAIGIVLRVGGQRVAPAALETAAEVLLAAGDRRRATLLDGAADALRERMRLPAHPWWARTHRDFMAGSGAEPEEGLGGARLEGRALSMDAALRNAAEWMKT